MMLSGYANRTEPYQQMLQLLDAGKPIPHQFNAPIALWQFGQDLTLVGLPGEPVVDFVALTDQTFGPLNLWVAGYCNDNFGYLPSARVLREGGYETRGVIYGGTGVFHLHGFQPRFMVILRVLSWTYDLSLDPPPTPGNSLFIQQRTCYIIVAMSPFASS